MSNILVGKTITKIELADDRQAIRFHIEGGEPIIARCDADCCSHTWAEHIEMPVNGLPATVLSAECVNMPDLGNGDAECIKYYGFKIVTDKGDIVIDYRNSSNGYYGGSLSWPEDHFYGGVYGQNVSNENWKEIAA